MHNCSASMIQNGDNRKLFKCVCKRLRSICSLVRLWVLPCTEGGGSYEILCVIGGWLLLFFSPNPYASFMKEKAVWPQVADPFTSKMCTAARKTAVFADYFCFETVPHRHLLHGLLCIWARHLNHALCIWEPLVYNVFEGLPHDIKMHVMLWAHR